ncbi:TlpA family protein disulfide reductase [Fulvivirga lutimaris]|uniref:TlpA family protein disulfide reductase n=1 Tax=Fulvivirga lutimaris TaxID=1819566 RepID=UPI0012BC270E|nr:TlpA disulfide reductase family protein [Fulvivirga lutimaris]MTI40892.1 TlpA family protein disulfide reductase [Fulvivirga lutimaris]
MVRFVKKVLLYFLIFITSAIAITFSILIGIGMLGVPESLNHIVVFILITIITHYSLSKTKNILSPNGILAIIIVSLPVIFYPKAINSSLNFTLNTIPFFISFLLAVMSGYIIHKKRSFKLPMFLSIIPLTLTIGLAGIIHSKIYFGSVDGQLKGIEAPVFNVLDKSDNVINNDFIKNKIVVMDFWFVSCPTCWVKFPELQRIHEKYSENDQVVFYAVNRPMYNDGPDQLFTAIEKKNYTFPVVRGSEELMNDFGIAYYPTTIIIDANGNIIFKGDISQVEETLEKLISS